MPPSFNQWIDIINKAEANRKRKREEDSPSNKSFEALINHEKPISTPFSKIKPITRKEKPQSNKNFIKLLLLIIGISLIAALNINAFSFEQKCALLTSIFTLTASTYLYNKNVMKEIKKDFTVKNLASFGKGDENIVLKSNKGTSIKHGSRRYPMSNYETTKRHNQKR